MPPGPPNPANPTALLATSITGGDTTHAPDGNAVWGIVGGPPLSTASSVTRLGAVVVSGAGTSAANGQYTERGTYHDTDGTGLTKPFYTKVGQATPAEPAGDANTIIWHNTQWIIDAALPGYISADAVATPDLVTTWEVDGGDLPVPTVTFQPGLTGLSYGARVRQVDNGFTYYLTNPADPSSASSWQAEPKVYRTILNQSGADAPVPIILQSNVATVTPARMAAGYFVFSCVDFAANLTFAQYTHGYDDMAVLTPLISASEGEIGIRISDVLGAGADGMITSMLEILVYP